MLVEVVRWEANPAPPRAVMSRWPWNEARAGLVGIGVRWDFVCEFVVCGRGILGFLGRGKII